MSEESNERYVLEIGTDVVLLIDTEKNETLYGFTGPNRLLAATAELNRLKEREEDSVPAASLAETGAGKSITPAAFLAETLPVVARRQRLEGHLAEVREIRSALAQIVAEQNANLDRVLALEHKLMKELSAEKRFGKPSAELDTPSGPLGATEAAQNTDLVGQGTRTRIRVLDGHARGALGVLLRIKTRFGKTYRVVKLDGEDFERTYLASLIATAAELAERPRGEPGPY